MTNPFVSNVYDIAFPRADDPSSFESICYTSPAPQVITVFRTAMQAPQWDFFPPNYEWVQDTPLPMRATRVDMRAAMQAPDFRWDWYSWRQADNPVNLLPLHGAVAGIKFRTVGSAIAGDPQRTTGSKGVQ